MKIKLLKDNPYGYRIDISGGYERDLYREYKKLKGIPLYVPLSDEERFDFERWVLGEKWKSEAEKEMVEGSDHAKNNTTRKSPGVSGNRNQRRFGDVL